MQKTLTAPVLPEVTEVTLDPSLGDTLGDDILLDTVKNTKVAKVRAGDASSRAWSMGGRVD